MNRFELVARIMNETESEFGPLGNECAMALGLLLERGYLKLRVTNAGLTSLAKDGLVRVRGRDHLVECNIVQLAARAARRPGECSCGSVPS